MLFAKVISLPVSAYDITQCGHVLIPKSPMRIILSSLANTFGDASKCTLIQPWGQHSAPTEHMPTDKSVMRDIFGPESGIIFSGLTQLLQP
jgi:hypothetical protein